MKKIFGAILLAIMLLFVPKVGAEYTLYKTHTIMQRGDTIYFDAKNLDWSKVYIHIWEQDGATYKEWANDDEMVKVEGTESIYKFTIPEDMEEKYNKLIFHNIDGGSANQTISLSYVEDKFAYVVNDYSGGKRIGYWYLYDKSTLLEQLATLKEYQENKEYYTSESYGNLDEIITNIEREINGEIKLEKDPNTTDKYYLVVEALFSDTEDIVDNLEVDPTELTDLIDEIEGKLPELEEEYTKDSIDELKDLIDELKEQLENGDITIDELKEQLEDLETKLEELEEQADKEELEKELDEIKELDKDDYTEESFKALEEVEEEAKEILEDTNAKQDDVDEAVEKLKNARKNLKEKEKIVEEVKEDEIAAPRTGDSIIKTFGILAGSIVLLLVIITSMKKTKIKEN